MNRQAARDFEAADGALNRTYQRFLAKLDQEAQVKLRSAQRAWVRFRDAEADLAADLDARGGTMAPLIYNGRRTEMTRARTKEFEQRLKDQARRSK